MIIKNLSSNAKIASTRKLQRMNKGLNYLKQIRNKSIKAVGTGVAIVAGVEVTTKLPSEGRKSQIYHDFSDKVVTPLMRTLLKPEDAHNIALYFLQKGLAPKFRQNSLEASSSVNLSIKTKDGLTFPNCIGLAAGFDKDGVAIKELMDLGFGFVEIGSVTPEPQPGNPKPRMFRLLEDGGIINRFGFNSIGMDAVAINLQSFRDGQRIGKAQLKVNKDEQQNETGVSYSIILALSQSIWSFFFPPLRYQHQSLLGVNLGKNKTSTDETRDYEVGIQKLGKYADYLVVNISSPNTPGLRNLQQSDPIRRLLTNCIQKRNEVSMDQKDKRPPLFVKIAPDLSDAELEDISKVVLDLDIDGVLVTNTSNQRPNSLVSKHKLEIGGLSGSPIRDLSTQCIRKMYRFTGGNVFIVGIGGVGSGKDAYEKLKAGASVVQIYSRMTYEGPGVVSRIRKELSEILRDNGHREVIDVVGLDHEEIYWNKKLSRAKKSIENENVIVDT